MGKHGGAAVTARLTIPTVAEIRRALKAAKAEGFDQVELTTTPTGVKVLMRRRNDENEGADEAGALKF